MKICVVIPAHNEDEHLGPLIQGIKEKRLDVVVIDDGSTDHTGTIAHSRGAHVLRNEPRQGKGASLQRGFDYALHHGYDGVIVMDGDGQHAVSDLDAIIYKAVTEKSDIVTGNRMEGHEGMPLLRLCTNRFMSSVISIVCKQKIPDTQCGYRFIAARVLQQIKLTSAAFEIETEVLVEASKKGFKIASVPIKTIYGNEHSKINPVKDTFRFLVYIFKEILSGGRPHQ